MKIGVISDIHGNHIALDVVLAEFRLRGISDVFFLGDIVGYYPFAKECVAMLAEFQVVTVRGNHDQVGLDCMANGTCTEEAYRRKYGSALNRVLEQRDLAVEAFLHLMPVGRRLSLEGRTLLLCHGSPWDELNGRVYPDFKEWDRFAAIGADGVLMGHTHHPFLRECGSTLVVNPGSVGQPRKRSGVACAAVLELPSLSVSLLELPYDPTPLIVDAREHDPDVPYLVDVLQR